MVKKKNTTQQNMIEPTELIKPRSQFSKEIEKQMAKGVEIRAFKINSMEDFIAAERMYSLWNSFNDELLKQSFSRPINDYRGAYESAGDRNIRIVNVMDNPSFAEKVQKFHSRLNKKLDNLMSLHQRIELIPTTHLAEPTESTKKSGYNLQQVFIVHGHDNETKLEIEKFITKLGFEPIILHDQVSSGKTIIEKIEEYSNVGFGIVLYTPCDVGAKESEKHELKSRARQNVVFEHGYLIGKIGRKNVCALVKGQVETPNDISGVVYISLSDEWKIKLARELKSSRYDVDMNLIE